MLIFWCDLLLVWTEHVTLRSSSLPCSLFPGSIIVETEDWRPDLEGTWMSSTKTNDNGWVYTNDTWIQMDPQSMPLED
ncbi:hypothetical protein BC835DRAFT_1336614 [Cytidiella melzeri]|nr:hypothetical protein BC835DRAFT_1336614 [Cytidiella melzeri]